MVRRAGLRLGCMLTRPAPRNIAKELITDLACSLIDQSGVDIVRIVSDSQTCHAVVNEFGHRGVPVFLQAVN